jgi:arginase family enzyme
MMNLGDYFIPVPEDIQVESNPTKGYLSQQIHFAGTDNHPDQLGGVKVALFSVNEYRGAAIEQPSPAGDLIRKQLYQLSGTTNRLLISDYGELRLGNTLKDTYFALMEVITQFRENNIIPVILGGTMDLTYGLGKAYVKTARSLHLCAVAPALELNESRMYPGAGSFVKRVLLDHAKTPFIYSHIGHQAYYTNPGEVDLLHKFSFEACRLGLARQNINTVEPMIRDADIFSLSLNSIKASDAPSVLYPTPNGFYSEEACQLAYFAGTSDQVSSFGLFDLILKGKPHESSIALAAQITWHFLEGLSRREMEYPTQQPASFKKFLVRVNSIDQEMVFYKSSKTGRWWMEVPLPHQPDKVKVIACSIDDYQVACNQDIPDRWFLFQARED